MGKEWIINPALDPVYNCFHCIERKCNIFCRGTPSVPGHWSTMCTHSVQNESPRTGRRKKAALQERVNGKQRRNSRRIAVKPSSGQVLTRARQSIGRIPASVQRPHARPAFQSMSDRPGVRFAVKLVILNQTGYRAPGDLCASDDPAWPRTCSRSFVGDMPGRSR